MAAVDDVAIRRALREVCEGTIAGVRALTPGVLSADIAGGASDLTLSRRGVAVPRVDIAVAYPMLDERPQQPSNIWMRGIEVTLTYTYLLEAQTLLAPEYQAIKSTAAETSDLVAQAFAWPGKLTTTSTGVATGIVSGVLMWQGTTVVRDDAPRSGETEGGGLYQLEQRYTGVVLTAAAIT